LDLFQLHSPPLQVVERGEWEPALEALKKEGKIRYYGVSCDTIEAGLAALRYPGVSSLQFTLSLLERRAVDDLLPPAAATGVACIARECLANGLLAKDADELDLNAYCHSPEERTRREAQLAQLRRQALEDGTSLMRIAIEYAAGAKGVSVALVGPRTVDQLRSLLAQVSRGKLAGARL
jgi:aryl-alcohol dehydrogenase-like predicted oxidoreductase